jgi:hypothetical protein
MSRDQHIAPPDALPLHLFSSSGRLFVFILPLATVLRLPFLVTRGALDTNNSRTTAMTDLALGGTPIRRIIIDSIPIKITQKKNHNYVKDALTDEVQMHDRKCGKNSLAKIQRIDHLALLFSQSSRRVVACLREFLLETYADGFPVCLGIIAFAIYSRRLCDGCCFGDGGSNFSFLYVD